MSPDGNDPLLAPLFAATTDAARDAALEVLVIHTHPIAKRVVAHYRSMATLDAEDAQDVVATVQLRLLRRLRTLVAEREEQIERLEDYVAKLTYHTIYDFLRRRFPERMRLKNRIRYLLDRDPRFRVWQARNGTVCELSAWKSAPRGMSGSIDRDWSDLNDQKPADAVMTVLRKVHAPILLDDLVSILENAWNLTATVAREHVSLADFRPNCESAIDARTFIERLWREILLLPQPQRAALLLNLRDQDGGNAVTVLLLLGIATIDGIADAVGLAPERLAAIWNDLPLGDQKIAEMLNKTRQQIINLRKAARARLTRRLAKESM